MGDSGDSGAADPQRGGGAAGPGHGVLLAMEEWLSSESFESAWKREYAEACRGSGRSDRNIAEEVLLSTIIAVYQHMPEELQLIIPEPDLEFIDGAVGPVLGTNLRKSGVENLEDFERALQAVYAQLAHCAALMAQQLQQMAQLPA